MLVIIVLIFIISKIFKSYITSLKVESNNPISICNFKVNETKEEVQKICLIPTTENHSLEPKLAPGTSGSFTIIIDTTGSDVGIKYSITSSNEIGKPRNLKFFYDEKEFDSFQQMEEYLTGTISANDQNRTKTFEIKWKWEFETGSTKKEIEQNDEIDTEDMKNIRNYNFIICVSGEQMKL